MLCAGIFTFITSEAGAATFTWDNGSGDGFWTTATNWNPNTTPANDGTADIVFQSDQGNGTVTPWRGSAWSVNSYTINGTGANTTAYTFQGSGNLTIGAGGLSNTSNNWQTFNENVTIGASQTWTSNMVTKMNLNLDINGNTLNVNGTSSLILKTWNSGANIRGAGTVNVNGELVTENDNSSFTGTFNVNNGGKMTIGESDGLGTTAGGTTVASGGQLILDEVGYGNLVIGAESLSLGGSGHDSDGTGALRSMDGSNSISGAVSLTSGTTIGVDSGSLTLSGIVSGANSLTKVGSGSLILSGDNTYSGSTSISAGTLEIQHVDGMGDSGSATTTTVSSGTTLALNVAGTIDNENLSIAGTGVSSAGAIDHKGANSTTVSGTVTMTGDSTIDVSDSGGSLTLSGAISGAHNLTKTDSGTLVLSGTSANTASGDLNVSAGTVQLNKTAGTDAWAGDINLSGGTFQLGAANQVNDSSNLTITGGTFDANGNTDTMGTLTLNGDSIIDFGSGDFDLSFSDLAYTSGTVKVYNWTGTYNWEGIAGTSGSDTRLLFSGLGGYSANDYVSNIWFYSDNGSTLLGQQGRLIAANGGGYELVAVPEASTWLSLAGLFALGYLIRQRRKSTAATRI